MPPTCEFTTPCTTTTTQTTPLRKVISHVFGRNKTATKQLPDEIWVHYCRKHYQRARYRCRNWAREQCELLLVSLDRLEEWGGVEGFEVVLRRREWERLRVCSFPFLGGVDGGVGLDEGEGEGVGDVHGEEEDLQSDEGEDIRGEDEEDIQGEGEDERRRKRPTIHPSPVPCWLREETGSRKSFAEMRQIICRLRKDFEDSEGDEEKKQFPDVEILPIFREVSS